VVEWLTLLLRIREVPGSNLGQETAYPDWGISWFSAVPPGECWSSTVKLHHGRFVSNTFQSIIIQLSPIHSTFCIVFVTWSKLQTFIFANYILASCCVKLSFEVKQVHEHSAHWHSVVLATLVLICVVLHLMHRRACSSVKMCSTSSLHVLSLAVKFLAEKGSAECLRH
jgi:hypothetical protein